MNLRLQTKVRGAILTIVGIFGVFGAVYGWDNLSTTGGSSPTGSTPTLAQVTAAGASTSDLVTLSGGYISGASSTVVGAITSTATSTAKNIAFTGGFVLNRVATINSSYTIVPQTDYYLSVSTTNLAVTVNLPSATSVSAGTEYIIKDATGNASSKAISVVANGTNTIDATTTQFIANNFGVMTIVTDGASNWEMR